MNHQTEKVQLEARLAQRAIRNSLAIEGEADSLLEQTRDANAVQENLLDAPTIDTRYAAALAAQIENKRDQAERIEEALENLVDRQSSSLQQAWSLQPGIMSRAGLRSDWQLQVRQQQSTLQRLQERLELVREIKDGMNPYGPCIEELAARKLRRLDPDLANEWDELQASQRRQRALQRLNEHAVDYVPDKATSRRVESFKNDSSRPLTGRCRPALPGC